MCDFVFKYITAQLPDPHKQPELYKKVKEVQMHSRNHSKTCFKRLGADCRFGYPKPPYSRTMITRPKECNDESLELEEAKSKLRPLNRLLNDPEMKSLGWQSRHLFNTESTLCDHIPDFIHV